MSVRADQVQIIGHDFIPRAVIDSILKGFEPADAVEILRELKYDSLGNYFYFTRHGMFYGVEHDGYMHT